MAVLTSKLIVELLDRASKPAAKIAATINKLQSASRANSARLEEMRGRMMGAVGAGFALYKGFSAPIRAGAEFQTMLEDIRQKAEMSAPELKTLGNRLRDIATATNQLPTDTIKTFDSLLGLGLGGKTDAENVDAAVKMLPAINKTATAYRAAADDVMKAGQASFMNLKVPADQMMSAFDAMARAGKEGAFELKDMAQYFPALTSQAGALGIKGVKGVANLAAALQVVRQGAGDSSEAATNLKNVMQKIMSPVTQTNFKKFGVDFRKEMEKAKKAGVSPIEAVARLTDKVLKKNKSATLGDLFADREAQLGLLALIAGLKRYREIRAAALNSSGEVEKDFAKRIQTADAAMIRFKGAIENLNIALSIGLLPALTAVIDRGIVPMLRAFRGVVEAHPKLVGTLLGVSAGLIGLRIAATAAQFAFLWMRGGAILAAIAGMKALAAATRLAAAPMWLFAASAKAGRLAALMLVNPLKLVTGALRILQLALLGTGIGAALVALAVAGTFIYQNWSGIKEMFAGIGEGIMSALQPVMPAVEPVIKAFDWLADKFMSIAGPLDASKESWRSLGVTIGTSIGGTIKWVIDKVQALIDLLSSAAGKVSGLFKAGGGKGSSPFVSNSVAGARANGGPVRRGSTYLVGERGPELWRAPAAGQIDSSLDTIAALRAGGAGGRGASGVASMHVEVGGIHIHTQPGQSPEAIASAVERHLSSKLNALSRGAFSDGVY